jgi:segregation and condensation protein A
MIETDIHIRLDQFDGPFALLLQLIQREEMAVKEIDINQITEQYLDFLKKMENLNFDIAGEYLYMAATLLFLKSQECVNITDNEELKKLAEEHFEITSKAQLIEKLELLERFQKIGENMWKLPKLGHEIFVRPKIDKKMIANSLLAPMDLQSLTNCMIDLIKREKRKFTMMKRDRLSIKEKLKALKTILTIGHQAQFTKLADRTSIEDTVITFISLLELARLKKLSINQEEDKGEIFVDLRESLDNFDPEVANGFEPEAELTGLDTKVELNVPSEVVAMDESLKPESEMLH